MVSKRLGVIAGAGDLPAIVAGAAHAQGYAVISIALTEAVSASLAPLSTRLYQYGPGQVSRILHVLREEQITELLLIGKIDKRVLFDRFRLDLHALRFLFRLPNRDDDTLLSAVIHELEREGFQVLSPQQFLADRFPQKGVLTKRKPTQREWRDIEYGVTLAKEIGKLSIGQTIVVRDRVVLAVEALEGTDEVITRGCNLSKGKAVVVKVSRPHQDMRVDVPTVGLQTVERMKEGKATVLAIEAAKTLLVDPQAMIEKAEHAAISIVAV
jgi:hypothetical protein